MAERTGKKRAPLKYESEADMCAAFIAWAAIFGWRAYAETGGWDILLVRESDGFQIGIEAKQSLCLDVIVQAIEGQVSRYSSGALTGPDCRAILVPSSTQEHKFQTICRGLHLTIITAKPPGEMAARGTMWQMEEYTSSDGETRRRRKIGRAAFAPDLPQEPMPPHFYFFDNNDWCYLCPDRRVPLPDYIPDVVAGASAPVALTAWKVRAIKASIIMETRGSITRKDFKALGLNPSRWTQLWLRPSDDPNRPGFVPGPQMPDFRAQHPRNYEEIKADTAKWMPPAREQAA